jgi:hypothetical protein
MLEDRLSDRVKTRELIILDGTSREKTQREENWESHLERAFLAGKTLGQ